MISLCVCVWVWPPLTAVIKLQNMTYLLISDLPAIAVHSTVCVCVSTNLFMLTFRINTTVELTLCDAQIKVQRNISWEANWLRSHDPWERKRTAVRSHSRGETITLTEHGRKHRILYVCVCVCVGTNDVWCHFLLEKLNGQESSLSNRPPKAQLTAIWKNNKTAPNNLCLLLKATYLCHRRK